MSDSVSATLARAVLDAVAYADVFDFPLTSAELHRYVEVGASRAQVAEALRAGIRNGRLAAVNGYAVLPGRESIVAVRAGRAAVARRLWPIAAAYGRTIGRLPYVRMVAVTGALAIDNVEPDADIDYLIVTERGRLWVCRALVIALVRWARLRGHDICPNYFLSESALLLRQRNLFTAHELTQMVPLAGVDTYARLRRLNGWTSVFLPNADGPPRPTPMNDDPPRAWMRRAVESLGRARVVDVAERWEMSRKIRKFGSRANGHGEAAFCRDWCKGHFAGHGGRILAAYGDRRATLDAARDRTATLGERIGAAR